MKSYLPNRYRFAKNPNEKEPRDPELDVEIMSQKITLSSEFIKNIEIEK